MLRCSEHEKSVPPRAGLVQKLSPDSGKLVPDMTVHVTDYKPPAEAAELLDGLNPQQRQAVLHEGNPC